MSFLKNQSAATSLLMKLREQFLNRPWLALVAVALAFLLGIYIGGGVESRQEAGQIGAEIWTCSMHPSIRQPNPGLCPVCNMELVPVVQLPGGMNEANLRLTPAARRLAEIQTQAVKRQAVTNEVRLNGRVVFDETRVKTVTAWFPGRIDRLFVDYVGMQVAKGDHLAEIYSPEILIAERELQEAFRAYETATTSRTKESALVILDATREKLRLWGLSDSAIVSLERGGKISDTIEIESPQAGVVVERKVSKGEYVEVGTPLLSVVDLSQVWVSLEAYEVDLPWLRYGQQVEIEAVALPGEKITGVVSLIDPVVNPETRTVRVRVNVSNSELKLKPEMLVRGRVQSRLSGSGDVIAPNLAGKWISPMHPEIVKDRAGFCDVCGMPLVTAESLGYATENNTKAPLVVPSSAVLFTGKRSIVYVEKIGPEKRLVYEGREVVLGARAGDFFLVEEGLGEGERVVTNGAFKVDSAVQLTAGLGMMSREQPGSFQAEGGHLHPAKDRPLAEEAQNAKEKLLSPLFQAYLLLQEALAADDEAASIEAIASLKREWTQLDAKELEGSQRVFWELKKASLDEAVRVLEGAKKMSERREAFHQVSLVLIEAIEKLGNQYHSVLYRAHCPMAFDDAGAVWLQKEETINNPYFGAQMLRCGVIKGTYK